MSKVDDMIPDEVVEAAAKIVIARLTANELGYVDAEDPSDTVIDVRDFDLKAAIRAALEAAVPYMQPTVTTRTEQVNLPNGTVIISATGDILQHFNGYWFAPGSSYRHHLDEAPLPATVIHP